MSNWLEKLFIKEAKPALDRHAGTGEIEFKVQEKSTSITKNGTFNMYPDVEYNGIYKATIVVDVPLKVASDEEGNYYKVNANGELEPIEVHNAEEVSV